MKKNLIALCILDGWGIAPKTKYNAIANANPSFFQYLLDNFPHSKLNASESHVGLPEGQMGNSEVGHMIIGSGRTIKQDLPRINESIESGEIFKLPPLLALVQNLQKTKNSCHIIGLASDGAVHSHLNHMLSIAQFIASQNIKVHLHCITDGRDTSPTSGIKYIKIIEKQIKHLSNVSISTISGRYYAMDRDNRYERTKLACQAIERGSTNKFNKAKQAILDSYQNKVTDEFIQPQSSIDYQGIKNGDGLIFTNFRADRMRQLCNALVLTQPNEQKTYSDIITMTTYSDEISKYSKNLFSPQVINNNLSDVLIRHNIKQLRAAETEKYPHITFFFNSGQENANSLEKRILIGSPKISTYDLQPEMSAYKLTDTVVEEIETQNYQFLLINYANADMVGHTGNYHATLKAITTVDNCLKKLYSAIKHVNGTLIITADHGNAENMFDEQTAEINTAHTTNPVPFMVINKNFSNINTKVRDGSLADIAPTILSLYGIEVPKEMTGRNLIIHDTESIRENA